MADQADNLRQLIHEATPGPPVSAPGPPMIAVTGGRAGVGITTVAMNLATVMADGGERVLLVDADRERSSMAEMAGVKPTTIDYTVSDVLAGKCTAADAIMPGPAGTRLLANRDGRKSPMEFSRHAQQRLVAELQSLHSGFDLLVVDLGSGLNSWARRFWLHARLVLLVTTTDSSALMDSYVLVKRSVADGIGPDLRLVVNQCEDDGIATDAHCRISNACARFLSRSLPAVPSLPSYVGGAGAAPLPRVWESPDTSFGHAMLWLGRSVGDVLNGLECQRDACATACGRFDDVQPSHSTARC